MLLALSSSRLPSTIGGGLLPTTSRLPSLGQPQGEAANVMQRVGGAAVAGDRITIVPGVLAKRTFSVVFVSAKGARGVAWIVLQGDLSDGLVRMSQWSPALDNGHDPTDQDSRTSFPDKGGRSLRGRMLRERPPLRLRCAATPRRRSTRTSRNYRARRPPCSVAQASSCDPMEQTTADLANFHPGGTNRRTTTVSHPRR
jgi:hypothetical protein